MKNNCLFFLYHSLMNKVAKIIRSEKSPSNFGSDPEQCEYRIATMHNGSRFHREFNESIRHCFIFRFLIASIKTFTVN